MVYVAVKLCRLLGQNLDDFLFDCDSGACLPIVWFSDINFYRLLMNCDFFSELLNLEIWVLII